MRRPIALLLAALALFVAVTAAGDAPPLRWSRPILGTTPGAWSRVDLPDDVLAACRPGLPDLRVRDATGADVPYVLERSLSTDPQEWPAHDVESAPSRETTATFDRGARPPLADEASIVLDATEFLKPAVLEASDDAATWKEIARGSLFATTASHAGARMTTLRFAPNDRRYWRLRLDDRNGPPVTPRALRTGAIVPPATPPRAVPLEVTRLASESGETTYEVTLPSANLPVSELRLEPTDAAFARRVTVSERVLFRDTITRRAIGSATITRGPGGESLVVPLGELRGPALEIAIEDGASPALTLARASATVAPRSILLVAPASPSLAYGSDVLAEGTYDLAAVLARGRPAAVAPATLGPATDRGASLAIGVPPHGAALDESRWQTKAAISLPATDAGTAYGVAYLALEGVDPAAPLRVVDAASREVPFVFERAAHRARETAQTAVAESGGRTTVTLTGLASPGAIDALELTATAPDYFVRQVTVVETIRDARGPTGERPLGAATWERHPGDPATPLTIPISPPLQSAVTIRIDNGGNPALTLGPTTIERTVRRIDFVSAPGDSLALLAGNPAAPPPSYDLALLSTTLLSIPALPARLEPARDVAPAHAETPKWFWVVLIAAGLVVAAALARAMKPA